MRDAFGGAFMIELFLVFIFIYICFTAVALNYAKAFKVKNVVVDYLEENEIVNLDSALTAEEEQKLNDFFEEELLGKRKYNPSIPNFCSHISNQKNDAGERIAYCSDLGIVIRKTGTDAKTGGVYYTVSTYVAWDAGFLNMLTALNGDNKKNDEIRGTWRISGQTRLIVRKD